MSVGVYLVDKGSLLMVLLGALQDLFEVMFEIRDRRESMQILGVLPIEQFSDGMLKRLDAEYGRVAAGMTEHRDWSTRELREKLGWEVLLVEVDGEPTILVWPRARDGLDEAELERVNNAIGSFGSRELDGVELTGPYGLIEDFVMIGRLGFPIYITQEEVAAVSADLIATMQKKLQ